MRDFMLTVFFLFTGITLIYLQTDNFQAFTAESARRHDIEEQPIKLSDYQLIDATGKQVSFSDLQGKTLLIDFIYTRCPTVCTLLGSSYANLQRKIIKDKRLKNVALISISFDLTYDNSDTLKAYQQRYTQNPEQWYMFVPKSKQQLKTMLEEFGVVVIDDLYGGFIHNSAVHITNDIGYLVKVTDWQNNKELDHAINSVIK
jgi:protein SCO1/2